jgi:hypothetical protein
MEVLQNDAPRRDVEVFRIVFSFREVHRFFAGQNACSALRLFEMYLAFPNMSTKNLNFPRTPSS